MPQKICCCDKNTNQMSGGKDAQLWNHKENVKCSMCEYTINIGGGEKVKRILDAIRKILCKYLFCDQANVFKGCSLMV